MSKELGIGDTTNYEKNEDAGLRQDTGRAVHADEPYGRRKSVALNIIENPLKVCPS